MSYFLSIKKGELLSWLSILALLGSQFNYLIVSLPSPSEQIRYVSTSISPEFIFGCIFIAAVYLIYIASDFPSLAPPKIGLPSIMLILTSLFLISSIVYNKSPLRNIITVMSFLLYFFSARYIAFSSPHAVATKSKKIWFLITPLFLIFLSYFYAVGRIYVLEVFQGYQYLQPHIEGGIRSTEITIFVGLQLIYLFYSYKISSSLAEKVIILTLIVLLTLLMIVLFSVGAFSGLILIVTFYCLFVSKGYLKPFLISLFLIILICMVFFSKTPLISFVSLALEDKWTNLFDPHGYRGLKYGHLYSLITENPIWGVGWGKFVELNYVAWMDKGSYPHNNILGLAAENGVGAALSYVVFIISVIVVGVRILKRHKNTVSKIENRPIMYFSFMAIACFIFLQFKGLFQDTWQLKEIYFWAGMIVGIADWLQVNRCNSGCHRK